MEDIKKEITSLVEEKATESVAKAMEDTNSKLDEMSSKLNDVEEKATKLIPHVTVEANEYKGFNLKNGVENYKYGNKSEAMECAKWLIDTTKAMTEGVDAAGGFTVAPDFMEALFRVEGAEPSIVDACTIKTVSGQVLEMPTSTGGASAYFVTETEAVSASDATFGNQEITTSRLGVLGEVSTSLLEDSLYDIMNDVTETFSKAIRNAIEAQVLYGTSAAFTGILGATSNKINLTTTTVTPSRYVQLNDVKFFSNLHAQMTRQGRVGAKWILGNLGLDAVQTLKDSNGNLVYHPNYINGSGNIYGYGTMVSDHFAAAPAADEAIAAFGNLKNYVIGVKNQGLKVKVDDLSKMEQGIVRLYLETRVAGAPIDESLFGVIKTKA